MNNFENTQTVHTHALLVEDENQENEEDQNNDEFVFPDPQEKQKFDLQMVVVYVSVSVYIVSTSVTATHVYLESMGSKLSWVVIFWDVLCIDLSSVGFTMLGFVCTKVYMSIDTNEWRSYVGRCVLFVWIDVLVATPFAMIFGALSALMHAEFKGKDVALTFVEGFTGLAAFDFKQHTAAWHSLNPTIWPVLNLIWCLVTMHMTVQANKFMKERFGSHGSYVITVMSVCGISLLTVFGVVYEQSNVFYANVRAPSYRLMEFNLGLHFYFLLMQQDKLVIAFTNLLQRIDSVVYVTFLCVWWTKLGSPRTSDVDATCIRLYHFNSCLNDHNIILMRGCLLALTILTSIETGKLGFMRPNLCHVPVVGVLIACTAFCWPFVQVLMLVLKIMLGGSVTTLHNSLITFIIPLVLVHVAFLYVKLVKPVLMVNSKQLISQLVMRYRESQQLNPVPSDCESLPESDPE